MVDLISILNAAVSGVLIGSVYSLVAMGLSLIWGIMDIINFAQGDYMMLGAFITYWMLVLLGLDPMVSIIISFIVVFALGVLTQVAVIDHIIEAPFVSQVVSTFALLMIIRYGSETVFGPYTRRVETWYTGITYNYMGIILPLPEIIAFTVSILVTLTLYLFLNKTYVGVAMQAVSQNRDAAALLGINIRRMYWFAFGIAGLIIGVSETVSALFIIPTWKDVIAFLIFVIIILFRPTGLFGVKTSS